ncbi:LAME_0E04698g1_1 [Lachancea meyersii CBS 8951]|uniref:Mannosyltransferase n=1 Tax=Lachancea meyersii CBS 8951 TaxID=1266667 RepID=A0A1G4JGY9_9SACH|nr:LAME_0E04698g1_1 [Lachancea meyersii CBS 8951]
MTPQGTAREEAKDIVRPRDDSVNDVEKQGSKRGSPLQILIIFRIINSIFVNSYFQPDEFWQSLEPAHVKAFGYGELTWEWKIGLRSYVFPVLFEIVYRAVSLLAASLGGLVAVNVRIFTSLVRSVIPGWKTGLEMVFEMQSFPREIQEFAEYQGVIYGPKIMMAVFAAVGEWYAIQFTERVYSGCFEDSTKKSIQKSALVRKIALVLSATNFFNCFMITRTFSNTFEMGLIGIALCKWDWTGGQNVKSSSFSTSLFIGLLLCIQRPTNAFIWGPLGLFMVLNLLTNRRFKTLAQLIYKVVSILCCVVLLTVMIDYYFYGEVVFPALRFVKFNYISALSEFYGTAPWHFHLFQSVPLIAGYSLPLLILGLFSLKSVEKRSLFNDPLKQIKVIILLNIAVFSAVGHKEFRFMYSLQPLFLMISSIVSLKFFTSTKQQHAHSLEWYFWIPPFVSVVVAMSLTSLHETGVVEVTKYLHGIPKVDSVGFVMPCHSTPWQSHIHRNDTQSLWSITCDPPLHLLSDPEAREKLAHYMDESDRLYEDVPKFIYQNFPPVFRKNLRSPDKKWPHEWPEYLVIFEHLDDLFMREFLEDTGYSEETRFFNTLSHWDSKRAGSVIVYYKPPWF